MQISVIIPVYNRAKLISRAIESVLNQTYKVDEIIVIDDGSSDNTLEILKNFGYKIKVITQKNSGVSSARNRGIIKSSFDWITFLDSDDEWDRDKIKEQVEFHKNNPEILISHTQELWIRNGKKINQKSHHKKFGGFCFEENLDFCHIAPSSVMMKKDLFEKIGYFDDSLVVCEDYDLWLRVLREYPIGLIEKELVTKYAGHENQLSFSYEAMDRFRVEALLKHDDLEIVRDEILKKCAILINGAKKRNNISTQKQYEKIEMRYKD